MNHGRKTRLNSLCIKHFIPSRLDYESHRTVESHQKFVFRPLSQMSTTAPTYF